MPQPAAVRQGRSRRRQSLLRPRLSPQPPPAPLTGCSRVRAPLRRGPGVSAVNVSPIEVQQRLSRRACTGCPHRNQVRSATFFIRVYWPDLATARAPVRPRISGRAPPRIHNRPPRCLLCASGTPDGGHARPNSLRTTRASLAELLVSALFRTDRVALHATKVAHRRDPRESPSPGTPPEAARSDYSEAATPTGSPPGQPQERGREVRWNVLVCPPDPAHRFAIAICQ